ncbi:MAG: hypothetical protein RRY53_08130, partial [Pseudoflavonifractor sp.]
HAKQQLHPIEKCQTALCSTTLISSTKSGSVLKVDATLLHYSQVTIKGVFHTTPRHVAAALELLKLGVISGEDFVQNEYPLTALESAIREHASGKVIKNCIVYN